MRAGRFLRRFGMLCAGILLIPGLWKLAVVVAKSPRFAVREIEVHGCERLRPETVRSQSGVREGENILGLDSKRVAQRLEALVPIRRASVIKQFPGKVLIRIEERKAEVLVGIRDRLFYMDREAVVLRPVRPGDPLDLPVITGLENRVWKFGGPDQGGMVQEAMALLDVLNGSSLPGRVSEIHVDPTEGMSFYLEAFPVEIRVGWDGFRPGMERLKEALPRLAADPEGILSVDLRFQDQVIVKKCATVPKRMSNRNGISPVPKA